MDGTAPVQRHRAVLLYTCIHVHAVECKHFEIWSFQLFNYFLTCSRDWNPTRATLRASWSTRARSRSWWLTLGCCCKTSASHCWGSPVRRPSFSSSSRLRLNHLQQHCKKRENTLDSCCALPLGRPTDFREETLTVKASQIIAIVSNKRATKRRTRWRITRREVGGTYDVKWRVRN